MADDQLPVGDLQLQGDVTIVGHRSIMDQKRRRQDGWTSGEPWETRGGPEGAPSWGVRVLALVHESVGADDAGRGDDGLGGVGVALRVRGATPQVVGTGGHASRPDPTEVDLLVIMGAAEAAYDDSVPWLAGELSYVRRALDAAVPVLGICFGGQLLARALGAAVAQSPEPEMGWTTVTTSDASLVPAGPWLEFHSDRFELPPGAVEVARTPAACQAFTAGPHLGLQFHPEITPTVWDSWAAGWTASGEAVHLARRGVDLAGIRRRLVEDQAGVAARADRLVERFLARAEVPGLSR
jgi:GMP synthase (glutamine-hydrolysing)